MRRLLPEPSEDVDPYDSYRPPDPMAPVVRLNMVTSLDGRATDRAGRTGELGGPGDQTLFRTLRALADGILVGAGTVRVEGYGPHRQRPELAERRAADGRSGPARVVVISRSLALDPTAALFSEAQVPSVVLTCTSAPAASRARLARVAEVIDAGAERVDLSEALRILREDLGLAHILCEGGPRLAAELLDGGLVDELCLTVAPVLMGGDGPRIVEGLGGRCDMTLTATYASDGELYTRYRTR